jgi:hypothetical protein
MPIQSFIFLSILMTSPLPIIDGYISVFMPHTQPYAYLLYGSDGILQ